MGCKYSAKNAEFKMVGFGRSTDFQLNVHFFRQPVYSQLRCIAGRVGLNMQGNCEGADVYAHKTRRAPLRPLSKVCTFTFLLQTLKRKEKH